MTSTPSLRSCNPQPTHAAARPPVEPVGPVQLQPQPPHRQAQAPWVGQLHLHVLRRHPPGQRQLQHHLQPYVFAAAAVTGRTAGGTERSAVGRSSSGLRRQDTWGGEGEAAGTYGMWRLPRRLQPGAACRAVAGSSVRRHCRPRTAASTRLATTTSPGGRLRFRLLRRPRAMPRAAPAAREDWWLRRPQCWAQASQVVRRMRRWRWWCGCRRGRGRVAAVPWPGPALRSAHHRSCGAALPASAQRAFIICPARLPRVIK